MCILSDPHGHHGKVGNSRRSTVRFCNSGFIHKIVLLYRATDKSPHSTLAALKRTVHLFRTPVQIIVDGGREYLGEFTQFCEQFHINIHTIAPDISRPNGQVERVLATLKNALIMIKIYETEQWHSTLEELQLAMNCTAHRVIGVAPLTMITQRKHCAPPGLLSLVDIDNQTIDIEALTRQIQQ